MEKSAGAEKAGTENAEAWPATFFQFERSEPIILAACEAERRNWREGCLQAGAMIATRRGQERAGAGSLRRAAISVTARQRDGTQRHIV